MDGVYRSFRECLSRGSIVVLLLFVLTQGASAQSCFESSIVTPSPFMGNHGEIFKLLDGSYWQVQYEYEYLYEYYPNVIVCPSSGKMSVNGKSLSISRISASPAASRGAPTRALAVEFAKVEAVHPGWTKTMGTADFKTWLAKQPASVRKLEQSDRSDDAILLLDLYKRDADNRGNGVARGQIR